MSMTMSFLSRVTEVSKLVTSIAVISAFTIALFWDTPLRSEAGVSLRDTMQKFTPEELDKAVESLSTEIPLHMVGEDHQEFAREMINAGKEALGHGEKIYKGKHKEVANELGAKLANATKDELVAQIEKRYPDADSPVRKILNSVQDNPDAYMAMAAAALNADPEAAAAVVLGEMSKKISETYEGLIDEGKTLVKDLATSVIPGSDKLKAHGVDIGDVYIEGVSKWADLVEAGKEGKDTYVFDCLHRRYKVAEAAHGREAALDEVRTFGLKGFDCVAARKPGNEHLQEFESPEEKDALRKMADLYRGAKERLESARDAAQRLTTETTTLAEYGTGLDEITDLIDQFERSVAEGTISRTRARGGFSGWAQEGLRDRRPRAVDRSGPKVPQSGFAKVLWDWRSSLAYPTGIAKAKLQDFFAAVATILTNTFGPKKLTELTGLPQEDFLPKGDVKTFSEGRKDELRAEKQMEKDKSDPDKVAEKVEKDLKCNPELQKKSANGSLDEGFIAHENYATRDGSPKDPDFVDEDGCRPYGKAVELKDEPVTTTYQYEAPPKPDVEPKKETRCVALTTRVDGASARFKEGRIKDADKALRAVLTDIEALPDASACSDVRDRAAGNAKKIGKVVDILNGVKDVLTKCEPKGLNRYISVVEDATNVRLVALRNRMQRARPVAVRYEAAKDAFLKGDMGKAESQFRQALAKADGAGGWTCENIKVRINANINRIEKLKEISDIGVRAAEACDLNGISAVLQKVKGTTNPFLDRVYDRLASVPKKCEKKIGNQACQTNFGPAAVMNSSNADGTYTCSCAKGFHWKPNAEGSDRTCISTKDANKIAQKQNNQWCKKNSGSGYYAGPMNKDGRYWCLPTRKTANARCRQLNPGTNSYAGKVRHNGSHNCYAKSKRTVRRNRPRRRQTRRTYQPNYNDAAAAAAILGAIANGVKAYNNSKRPTYRRGNCQGEILGRGC